MSFLDIFSNKGKSQDEIQWLLKQVDSGVIVPGQLLRPGSNGLVHAGVCSVSKERITHISKKGRKSNVRSSK